MVVIGTFIRGPGWMWFWPGQTWDHNRQIFEVNRDLPDIFCITSPGESHLRRDCGRQLLPWWAEVLATPWTDVQQEDLPEDEFPAVYRCRRFCADHDGAADQDTDSAVLRIKYIWITPWFNV